MRCGKLWHQKHYDCSVLKEKATPLKDQLNQVNLFKST